MFGLATAGIVTLNATEEWREKRREVKDIRNQWNILMDSMVNSKSENNIEQTYEPLEIFKKHYGFNMIIGIPYSKSSSDLIKLIPQIEVVYGANVIIEPSENPKTSYMRVYIKGKSIDMKDTIKLKWYSFFQDNKFRNRSGQTYILKNAKDIINPNDTTKILGVKFNVEIPNGLSYSNLKAEELELSKIFGLCQIEHDAKDNTVTCELISNKVSDAEKFVPFKVNPWELYIGMENNWEKIILDYSKLANGLIAGRVGTGKTVSMITGILNLICTSDNFELFILMMGEKQDLAIFRGSKFTRHYAKSEIEVVRSLKYLINEMNRRNKLFASKNMCFNIFRYNSMVKEEDKLPIIHVLADEVADLMEVESTQKLMWNLIRKSRSSGIFLTIASQRFSLANISPEVKAQLSNKICFKMSNTASALTVVSGDNMAQRVVSLEPNREFLADYQDGVRVGKTLQLTEDYMIELMEGKLEDNKIEIDNNGNIVERNEKSLKNEENVSKPIENILKVDKNSQNEIANDILIEPKSMQLSRFEMNKIKKQKKQDEDKAVKDRLNNIKKNIKGW